MTLSFPQDTPITRADITQLTPTQLEELITHMRERRMKAYTAYQVQLEAKKRIKDERDRLRYEKVLDLLEKALASADKTIDKANKYVNELRGLELVFGE